MTGGFGHVRDMQIRDKNNRGLLQNIKEIHKKVTKAFIPKISYEKIALKEDNKNLLESSMVEILKIRKEARKRRITSLFVWLTIIALLTVLFVYFIKIIV